MAVTEMSTRANAALDVLYRRHVGDVYRYTYAVLGNHADAEDVTQTTFVNALRALERGEEPQNPSNWLLVIAHNVVRQRWRQAAARPSEVELVHDVPETTADDDVELDGLVRALQRIPPAQREVLVMRELEGRSYREIAELLGLTTSALETLLFRARRSLADELENVVTCQNAELAISRRLDDRLSRKERRRLEEHLEECADCARLADAQRRQRRAFKGLALLPLPVGLAIFKGAPAASAATLPTIGLAATGAGGTASAGATGTATGVGAASVGTAGAGAASAGGAAVGGSLVGGAVAKVAAVVVAAGVATGVGYEGLKAVREAPPPARPAVTKKTERVTPAVRAERVSRQKAETKAAKKAKHVVPARGRGNKATEKPKRKDVAVQHGRSGDEKTGPKVDHTGPRSKGPNVDTAGAKPKQPREPKAPKEPKAGAGPDAGKPKDAPPAAAPPADAPGGKAKETPPTGAGPSQAGAAGGSATPAPQTPVTTPSTFVPSQPPTSDDTTQGSGSKVHDDNGNHTGWDNGNHTGWDNANKDEKAASKP